jgi:nucleotide-binding universal stress UspA family protein
MSGPTFIALIAVVWLAIGLMLALVMGRRGHDRFDWLILGTLMGPIALFLAVDSRRHDEGLAPEIVSESSGRRAGVDVLAGIDGSTHSRAALRRATTLFGTRVGRLTLATVVPFDASHDQIASAKKTLEQAAKFVPSHLGTMLELEILHGHPATALQAFAHQHGRDVLVIGTRGAGLSKRLLGSAATELSHATLVPVLLVNGEPTDPGEEPREPMSAHEASNGLAVSAWARSARSV